MITADVMTNCCYTRAQLCRYSLPVSQLPPQFLEIPRHLQFFAPSIAVNDTSGETFALVSSGNSRPSASSPNCEVITNLLLSHCFQSLAWFLVINPAVCVSARNGPIRHLVLALEQANPGASHPSHNLLGTIAYSGPLLQVHG